MSKCLKCGYTLVGAAMQCFNMTCETNQPPPQPSQLDRIEDSISFLLNAQGLQNEKLEKLLKQLPTTGTGSKK